jgi:uncharacterized membrane protein YccC
MGVVSAAPRLTPLLGPPLPALPALWRTGGRRGVTAAVCTALPLACGIALGRADLGSAAALAAFTSVYGHALPYRRRAVVVAGVGVALTVASTLGALAGGHPVVLALAAAAGATLAWAGCLLPWLWDPTGPERRALDAAGAAVAAAERGGAGAPLPGAVAHAVRVADVAVRTGSRRGDGGLRDRLDGVEQRFLRALPVVGPDVALPPVTGVPGTRWWHAPRAATALRTGTGTAAAGLAAAALGLSSPYWAASTAVSVQLGTDARATRVRALQRAVGTALGVLLAGALVWADLPVAVEVLLVAVLQLAVELFIAHQYVLAVTCTTPLVLLLVHIGAPGRSGAALVTERLAETGVGVVLALVVGLALLPRAASRRLPGAVRATTEAARAAVAAAPGGPADDRLREALVQQREVAAAARAELFPGPAATAWTTRARAVADLGWGLLGARARGDGDLAASLTRRLPG